MTVLGLVSYLYLAYQVIGTLSISRPISLYISNILASFYLIYFEIPKVNYKTIMPSLALILELFFFINILYVINFLNRPRLGYSNV